MTSVPIALVVSPVDPCMQWFHIIAKPCYLHLNLEMIMWTCVVSVEVDRYLAKGCGSVTRIESAGEYGYSIMTLWTLSAAFLYAIRETESRTRDPALNRLCLRLAICARTPLSGLSRLLTSLRLSDILFDHRDSRESIRYQLVRPSSPIRNSCV